MSPNEGIGKEVSADERRQKQLVALVGRVEELERKKESPNYALMSYVDRLFPLAKTAIVRKTDIDLSNSSPALIVMDSSGIERTVTLPGASKGCNYFIIINDSDV